MKVADVTINKNWNKYFPAVVCKKCIIHYELCALPANICVVVACVLHNISMFMLTCTCET